MLISRVARRYALAMFDSLPEGEERAKIFASLTDLHDIFHSSRELQHFFASPIIPFAKKEQVLEILFRDRVVPAIYDMLQFLLVKRREGLLHEIIEAIFELDTTHRGVTTVDVQSQSSMPPEQREHLEKKLAELTGGPVSASYSEDSALIGGLVVRVGDTVYDGSVRRQLQLLRTRFISGAA